MSAATWSVVCMFCYEFARRFKAYDYRTFFKRLLGKGWILFELSYLLVIIIVLAVIAASAGNIGKAMMGLDYNLGVLIVLVYISYAVVKGNVYLETLFSVWSFLLYAVLFSIFVCCFYRYSDAITVNLKSGVAGTDWILSGIRYASFNLGLIPAVFFCLRHQTSTRQTLVAGLLTGPIAVIPGIFFYLSMLSDYPAILTSVVPSTTLLNNLNITWLYFAFAIVLFATLIETGVGLIHAFNERISIFYQEKNKKMPRLQRSIIAILCLSVSMGMAQFGLVELISKGYGLLTWLILCIFVIPLVFLSIRDFIKINVMRNPKITQNISSLE